jgi:hypothetical protein
MLIGRLRFWAACALIAFAPSGCQRLGEKDGAPDIQIRLSLEPEAPAVGGASATIALTDNNGRPVRGATLKLEGNMHHAGMKPVFADLTEREPGKYQAAIEFTMGGDWFIIVSGTLADGRRLYRRVDVPGVKAQ